MAKVTAAQVAFNSAEFGEEMSARIDFQKYGLAAAYVSNWMPKPQGGMVRAQGFKILKELTNPTYLFPFKSELENEYLLSAESGLANFFYDEGEVQAQPNACTITNGTFAGASPNGWTDSSTGTSSIQGDGPGLILINPVASSGEARADQEITNVTSGLTYNLKITVGSGPIDVSFGSSQGGADLGIGKQRVFQGQHVFEITPKGSNFWVRLASNEKSDRIVEDISSLAGGALQIVHSYSEAELKKLRFDQIRDRMFTTVSTNKPAAFSRFGLTAFGFGVEPLRDGPYNDVNTENTTLTPSGTNGDITLTSSEPLFDEGMVGRMVKLEHPGQHVAADATNDNVFTDHIKMDGSGTFRKFNVNVTGIAGGSVVKLQRSFNAPGQWIDYQTYTTNTGSVIDDTLDNQLVYYRIGIKSGDYGSGTVSMSLTDDLGVTKGQAEITAFNDFTSVECRVLDPFGTTDATPIWFLSRFGGNQGWPQNIAYLKGRFWLSHYEAVFGSNSDDFTKFEAGSLDDESLSRTVASSVRWLKGAGELSVGFVTGQAAAINPQSKVYTPTDFELNEFGNSGVADIDAVVIDTYILFVGRDGKSLFESGYNVDQGSYVTVNMMDLNPTIGNGGIKKIVIQRSPVPRIWCLKYSGELIVLTYLRDQDVVGWSRKDFDGYVEDIAITRGADRDRIYIVAEGTVNDQVKRYLMIYDNEEWEQPSASNHLDFSKTCHEPEGPDSNVRVSGGTFVKKEYTGTVLVTSRISTFTPADVGKRLYINKGYGDITAVTDKTATINVVVPLKHQRPAASGAWYMGAKTNTVTFRSEFEGEEVYGFADGIDIGPMTVGAGGEVTLPNEAGWVHIGRRQDAIWEGLKNYKGARQSTGIGAITKRVSELGLVLKDTGDCLAVSARGIDKTKGLVIPSIRQGSGTPGAVFSGEVRQTIGGEHEFDPRITIVADKASPAHILSIGPTNQINER